MQDNLVIKEYGDIKIENRKRISLTGVKRLISFNNLEFVIESKLGTIELKGNNLELLKLDTNDGNLIIKGLFNSLEYTDDKKRDMSFLAKLFK